MAGYYLNSAGYDIFNLKAFQHIFARITPTGVNIYGTWNEEDYTLIEANLRPSQVQPFIKYLWQNPKNSSWGEFLEEYREKYSSVSSSPISHYHNSDVGRGHC